MATLAEVQSDFTKYQSDVTAALKRLSDQVAALQTKLDAGSAIEAADLDTLKSQIDTADAALTAPPTT